MDGDNVSVNGRPPPPLASSGPHLDQQTTNYTIPGILHFIKHEWSRFEKERSNWEVERAELQAKIAFLQGERNGHENLMHDLVRRIKMLEFALKQERSKFYKLKHGTELVFADMKPPASELENSNAAVELTTVASQKEESRKILREYLHEVGFPDNVLEARMARISAYKNLYIHNQLEQSLSRGNSPKPALPPSNPPSSLSPHPPLLNGPIANGTDTQAQPSSPSHREVSPPHPLEPTGPPLEKDIRDSEGPQEGTMSEDNVLSSFNFLDEEDDDSDEEGDRWEDETSSASQLTKEFLQRLDPESDEGSSGLELDLNTESAMDDFGSPNSSGIESGSEGGKAQDKEDDWSAELYIQKYTQHKPNKKKNMAVRPSRREMEQFKNQAEDQPATHPSTNAPFGGLTGIGIMRLPGRARSAADPEALGIPLSGRGGISEERIEVSLLGDLAGLSISNENVGGGIDNPSTETVKKWENKFTMRSHFDAVTSVAFHPVDHTLVTGSEDCTLKVWNLQKQQGRRSSMVDVEPVHTFRGHRGSVLSVAVGASGDICFSGSTDTTIRVWQLPNDLGDPFDVYDPEVHRGVLQGHTDAIWDLSVHSNGLLLSCGGDGTCRLWNHQLTSPQVQLFRAEQGYGNPTSVDCVATDLHHIVASYTAAKTVVYDLETAKPVLNLDSASTYDGTPNTQINKVVCHPTLPIIVTGHEDKYIRFYDANTGKVIHSMTAHMDAVMGLAVDPHGLYLLSGSHDGSLRFWNMDSKICIQETTAHRKRFDESIYNVACHLSKPYFASAGADSIAKVFV